MYKLNIIVIVKNDYCAFERFLYSVKRQKTAGIKITALTAGVSKIKKYKEIYGFDIAESHGGILRSINRIMRSLDSEKFMIMYQDQMLAPDFCEHICAQSSFTLMNMAVKNDSGNFKKIYPPHKYGAQKCISQFPYIFSCVFDTETVRRNKIYLKSFKPVGQMNFLNACLKYAEVPLYIPDVFIYADGLCTNAKITLTGALLARMSKSKFYAPLANAKRAAAKKLRKLSKG